MLKAGDAAFEGGLRMAIPIRSVMLEDVWKMEDDYSEFIRMYSAALQSTYHDAQMVTVRLNLPGNEQ